MNRPRIPNKEWFSDFLLQGEGRRKKPGTPGSVLYDQTLSGFWERKGKPFVVSGNRAMYTNKNKTNAAMGNNSQWTAPARAEGLRNDQDSLAAINTLTWATGNGGLHVCDIR